MLQSPGVSSNSAPAGAAATALFSLPITKYGSPEVPGHVLWAAVEPPAPRQWREAMEEPVIQGLVWVLLLRIGLGGHSLEYPLSGFELQRA